MISTSRRFNRYNSVAATDRMTMQCIVLIITDVYKSCYEHPAPSSRRRSSPGLHRLILCHRFRPADTVR